MIQVKGYKLKNKHGSNANQCGSCYDKHASCDVKGPWRDGATSAPFEIEMCRARVVASSYGWTDTVLTAIYPSDNKLQLPTLLKPALFSSFFACVRLNITCNQSGGSGISGFFG